MVDEFPSNSRSAKAKQTPPERPKVEKVVTGDVVRRKKPLGRRLAETFFGSDNARGVAQYLAQDVVVPMVKDLITDVVTKGIEGVLYGESQSRGGSVRGRSNSPYVPYNRYTQGGRPDDSRRDISSRGRSSHKFDEIEYKSRAEAKEVLDTLFVNLEKYGSVTVADFYEASGVSAHFVDENHGWTDLDRADVRRGRNGGWVIVFPPTTDKL